MCRTADYLFKTTIDLHRFEQYAKLLLPKTELIKR